MVLQEILQGQPEDTDICGKKCIVSRIENADLPLLWLFLCKRSPCRGKCGFIGAEFSRIYLCVFCNC